MRSSSINRLVSLVSLVGMASAAAIAIPPQHEAATAPSEAHVSYTDFNAIYSSILKKVEAADLVTREEVKRQVITPPNGYEFVFGPTTAANSAPNYMGFVLLDTYDVDACAAFCNGRGWTQYSGACVFFNIWQSVISGEPESIVCSLYGRETDASTATNTGQDTLTIADSRGYQRINYVTDPSFESYSCTPEPGFFCYGTTSTDWTASSSVGGTDDATLIQTTTYARTGDVAALLGSVTEADALPGIIAPNSPIGGLTEETEYTLSFWHNQGWSSLVDQPDAVVELWWNGALASTLNPEYDSEAAWTYYEVQVTALGGGVDVFEIRGGHAPAYSVIDDVSLREAL